MSDDGESDYIVKLRGLPWSATVEDIQTFFKDCKIVGGKDGIHMTTSREGRPSGEAFVELDNFHDFEVALQKDRNHIGSRYIEVFKTKRAEMDWVIKRSGSSHGLSEDGVVRLRGLPFGCSKEEIAQFFTGLEIVPNGITLLTDYSGRSTGEAYVEFVNRDVAEKALQKHREKIGHRYIEIFRSSLSEVHSYSGYPGKRFGPGMGGGMFGPRPGPYDRESRFSRPFQPRGSRNFKGSNFSNNGDYYDRPMVWSGRGSDMGRHRDYDDSWSNDRNTSSTSIHMRGLPFKAREEDIADFFKPIIPIDIHMIHDQSGRASGEADVEFASHDDAVRAMGKDKSNMQHRYIELFLNGGNNSNSGGGYGGGPGGRRPFY